MVPRVPFAMARTAPTAPRPRPVPFATAPMDLMVPRALAPTVHVAPLPFLRVPRGLLVRPGPISPARLVLRVLTAPRFEAQTVRLGLMHLRRHWDRLVRTALTVPTDRLSDRWARSVRSVRLVQPLLALLVQMVRRGPWQTQRHPTAPKVQQVHSGRWVRLRCLPGYGNCNSFVTTHRKQP